MIFAKDLWEEVLPRLPTPDRKLHLDLPPAEHPEESAIVDLLESRGVGYTTWEGWLNAATLAPVRNVERSGRALISGKKKPIKSRLNKGVPRVGRVA